jgi:hypothetical protein
MRTFISNVQFTHFDGHKTFSFIQQHLKTLFKWCGNFENGYQRRVSHGSVVSTKLCKTTYGTLKEKHGYWAKQWPEKTDACKFVFEDIGIAAFLVNLMLSDEATSKT